MNVWIVQGEHPYVPGRSISVHDRYESACVEAAELVNIILKDLGRSSVAIPEDWESALKNAKEICEHDDFDVWMTELEVKERRCE